jgi:hypothetical protein
MRWDYGVQAFIILDEARSEMMLDVNGGRLHKRFYGVLNTRLRGYRTEDASILRAVIMR